MKTDKRTVVVTGGGSGIGLSIARKFAAEGDRVVIAESDSEKGSQAEDLVNGIKFIQCDVRSQESIEQMVRAVIESTGKIDVWVNNAGFSRHQASLELEHANWQDSIDVMQSGVFYCCQEAGRHMEQTGGGNIINITSINSTISIPGRLGYSCAKAAVLAMTKILASEWAPLNIRVNCISPGVTRTQLMQDSINSGLANEQNYLSRIPMGRFAEKEEIAEVVYFVSSDKASYMTGNNMIIDGGWTSYNWIDLNHCVIENKEE